MKQHDTMHKGMFLYYGKAGRGGAGQDTMMTKRAGRGGAGWDGAGQGRAGQMGRAETHSEEPGVMPHKGGC